MVVSLVWIRIGIPNADPDPVGIEIAKRKEKCIQKAEN
jgi:hypothetical protein